jgi:hypothetical protein
MSPNSWFSQPVFIPGGDPEQMNEPTLAYPGQLGIRFNYVNPMRTPPTEASEDGSPKAFQLVQSDSSMSVAPYDTAVAWWASRYNYLVTTNAGTPGRSRVAGIFKTAVTPGNFCCVQQKGRSAVKIIDAPTAAPTIAGLLVVPSATNAKADVLAAASAYSYGRIGMTTSVMNLGDNTCLVELDIPEVL